MDNELKNRKLPTIPLAVRKPKPTKKTLPAIDIAMIGAAGFARNLTGPDPRVYTVSLDEIDRLIEIKTLELEPTDDELMESKLPADHRAYADTFSKEASDQLQPHRSYDHKIQLDGPATSLSYHPLRNQTREELEATRQYLVENLGKGFIDPSQAPLRPRPSLSRNLTEDYGSVSTTVD
jgi:hypothetical protein